MYKRQGFDPSMEVYQLDGKLTVCTGAANCISQCQDPAAVLREILEDNKAPKLEGLPPFTGGLAGYFSYEYIQCVEKDIRWSCENEEHFKDFDLMFLDKLYILSLIQI